MLAALDCNMEWMVHWGTDLVKLRKHYTTPWCFRWLWECFNFSLLPWLQNLCFWLGCWCRLGALFCDDMSSGYLSCAILQSYKKLTLKGPNTKHHQFSWTWSNMCACRVNVVPFFLPQCHKGGLLTERMKKKKRSSSLQCLSCTCNRSELCKRFEDFVECHSSLTDRAANLCGSFSCICCPFVSHMRSLLHLNLWRLWTAGELLESLDIFSELPRRTSFAQRLLTQFFLAHICSARWNGSRQRSSKFLKHVLSYFSLSENAFSLSCVWSTSNFFSL